MLFLYIYVIITTDTTYENEFSEDLVAMENDNRTERRKQIIQILRERNGASIKQLSDELNVSEMTIRRDLETLQINKIVNLVHGAAIYNSSSEKDENDSAFFASLEIGVMGLEKVRIGKAAAKLVEPSDVIFIDDGTTTCQLIKHLPSNLPITLVCCTLNALMAVQKKKVERLIFTGGYHHVYTELFECPESIQMIQNMRASKVFLSTMGISEKLGLTCGTQYELNTKKAFIESSQQKILMADSSKFGVVKSAYFCDLNQLDMIITDSGLSNEWQQIIQNLNIELIIV